MVLIVIRTILSGFGACLIRTGCLVCCNVDLVIAGNLEGIERCVFRKI